MRFAELADGFKIIKNIFNNHSGVCLCYQWDPNIKNNLKISFIFLGTPNREISKTFYPKRLFLILIWKQLFPNKNHGQTTKFVHYWDLTQQKSPLFVYIIS